MENDVLNEQEQQQPDGQYLMSWTFQEFERVERGLWWYVAAGTVMAALFAYALWQASYLFALILALATVTFVYNLRRDARTIEVNVDELGIVINGHFMPYADFSEFWLAYNPPIEEDVYLKFNSPLKPGLTLPLNGADPLLLRETLASYIPENLTRESATVSETLKRKLKL